LLNIWDARWRDVGWMDIIDARQADRIDGSERRREPPATQLIAFTPAKKTALSQIRERHMRRCAIAGETVPLIARHDILMSAVRPTGDGPLSSKTTTAFCSNSYRSNNHRTLRYTLSIRV